MSTDQKYLFEMCHAVASGVCGEDIANRQPGNMVHSRWLTTANRILRLYVGTNEPSYQLQVLVDYDMKVYAPSSNTTKCILRAPRKPIVSHDNR